MINATVEEKLKSEAEFGLFVANFKIGKTKDIITNLTTCSKILEIAYG